MRQHHNAFRSAFIALLTLSAPSSALAVAGSTDFAFKCVTGDMMMTYRGHDGQVCMGIEPGSPVSAKKAAELRCAYKEKIGVSDAAPRMFTWLNIGHKTRLFLDADHSRLIETDLDGNNPSIACHPLLPLAPN